MEELLMYFMEFLVGGDLSELLNSMISYYEDTVALIGFFILALGAMNCFFGYKLFKFWMAVSGFFMGGILGALLGAILSDGELGGMAVFGMLGCALGAYLSLKLYKLGVFFMLFIVSFLAMLLFKIHPGIALMVGVLIGIVGLYAVRPVVIFSTAIGGGLSSGLGTMLMLSPGNMGFYLFAALAFMVAGVIVQLRQPIVGTASTTNPVPPAAASLFHPAPPSPPTVPTLPAPTPAAAPVQARPQTVSFLPTWPVVPESLALHIGEERVAVAYTLRNQTNQMVRSAYFTLFCFDDAGDQVGEPLHKAVMEVNLASQQLLKERLLELPDFTIRKIIFTLDKVTLGDETVWKNDGTPAIAVPSPQPLAEADRLLLCEGEEANGLVTRYYPQQGEGWWRCSCGTFHSAQEELCYNCNAQRKAVFTTINEAAIAELGVRKEAANQERQRLEAEAEQRRLQELEERRAQQELEAAKERQEEVERQAAREQQRRETMERLSATLHKTGQAAGATAASLAQKAKQGLQSTTASRQPQGYPGDAATAPEICCPACGELCPPDAAFCTGCGKPLLHPGISCPDCGHQNPEDGFFCEACGTDLRHTINH